MSWTGKSERLRTRFDNVRINPLSIASATFMLLAPFGAWMTLSAFGYVSGSDLWEITRSQTSFPIGQNVASTAVYSSILLILAGLISFKRTKFGLPLAAAALLLFSLESYSTFGTFPGTIPVSILPGLGFFLAVCGIILGLGAPRINEMPITSFIANVRTRIGLGQAGILVTSIFLAAEGWNHWSSGQLSEFLGVTLLEGILHRVFFLGIAIILMIFLVQRNVFLQRTGMGLVLATFGALILDAAYHFTTGGIVDFVGHDGTEVLLHALTYYGAASLVVARVLLRR